MVRFARRFQEAAEPERLEGCGVESALPRAAGSGVVFVGGADVLGSERRGAAVGVGPLCGGAGAGIPLDRGRLNCPALTWV